MKIYIIQYSENPKDDICDSSIIECYSNEDFAVEELRRLRKQNEDDRYTYYLSEYWVNEGIVRTLEEKST